MNRTLVALILLLTSATRLAAQDPYLDTIQAKFDRYRQKALTEKIYAHLDRSTYLTGETVWFKLYCVDGSFHRSLDLSKVAYVEVLSGDNQPVLQAKIELNNGLGHGSFFLPASLATGNYQFRAYTNWMKNFHPGYFYNEVIAIVNPFLTPDQQSNAARRCTLDFFPEGGNLVAGIESKVAFRMTGKGSACSGHVETSSGELVASLAADRNGLGSFVFTPRTGVTYRGVITDASGNRHFMPFPEPLRSGYAMSLVDSSNTLFVTVRTQGVDDERLYLFSHARQIIGNAQVKPILQNKAVFQIEKDNIPKGVSHITVFNSALQPVCERLHFSMPERSLQVTVEAGQKTVGLRKKVPVSIKTTSGAPVSARASVSVYKIDSLTHRIGGGIYPYLWLASDLGAMNGSLADLSDSTYTAEGMDLVMLTHGWRRFEWQQILQGTPEIRFLPEVREHIVTAVITEGVKEQRGVLVYLGSPGKIIRAYGGWTNEDGEVRFEVKDFYGPRRTIVETADSTRAFDISIVNPFSPEKTGDPLPPLVIGQSMKSSLESRSIAMQVQDIYYYDEYGTQVEIPAVDSTAFYGTADATYLLDDYTRFPLLEEVMREYVPGVFVRKRKDGFHFLVVDRLNRGILPGDPMVLLDGVPVTDVDDIMRVDPRRIRKLEVVNRPYYLGQATFSGIVSYTTYEGDLGGIELDPRSISLDYDGLQLKRVFHTPHYNGDDVRSRLPDQRFLLHWQPEIATDGEGNYNLEFFTSDVPGDYVIVVDALSDTGDAGRGTYMFKVKSADSQ